MGIGNMRISLAALIVALGAGCGGTPAKSMPDMNGGGGIGGNAFLVNVLTKANVNGSMTPVRELNTIVGFSPIGGIKPDYDDRQGLFGCSASHLANGKTLGSDSDAGTVNISMYSAANFLDGTAAPGFQFQVGQPVEHGGEAEIVGAGISDRLIQMAAHRRQTELIEFLGECAHRSRSFQGREKRRIPPATKDRSPVDPVPDY